MEDAVKKATDVREKVKVQWSTRLRRYVDLNRRLLNSWQQVCAISKGIEIVPTHLIRTTVTTVDPDSEMFVHVDQVCEWRSPEQLKELLDLELRDDGESESEILQRCRDAIRYSVKTSKSSNLRELGWDTVQTVKLKKCFLCKVLLTLNVADYLLSILVSPGRPYSPLCTNKFTLANGTGKLVSSISWYDIRNKRGVVRC